MNDAIARFVRVEGRANGSNSTSQIENFPRVNIRKANTDYAATAVRCGAECSHRKRDFQIIKLIVRNKQALSLPPCVAIAAGSAVEYQACGSKVPLSEGHILFLLCFCVDCLLCKVHV